MHEPYLALYVKDGALHFEKKIPTESKSREIFDVALSQIVADDFDEASKRLGSTILGILKIWHKDSFEDWGNGGALSSKSSSEDFMVALGLINRLSAGCSEDRLKLIDEILADAASSDLDAKKYLDEDWPSLRRRLLR